MEKKTLNDKLLGKRIYLKKHELSLAETMFHYVDQDRERLDRFLPWVGLINNVQDEIQYIKSTHQRWDECSYFDYGIFKQENNTYMGNIGVHSINWAHNGAELGYWILGGFEGKGYVSEAVQVLEKHLFEKGFHRVQICCSDLNERSAKVPESCDYTYEGTMRDNVIEKGQYRNTKVYSKLVLDRKE